MRTAAFTPARPPQPLGPLARSASLKPAARLDLAGSLGVPSRPMEGSVSLCAPVPRVSVALVVLNYNGRSLLQAYLPSVVAAATRSQHACKVWVLDNASTDDSLDWLAQHFPHVNVWQAPNLGLASYNDLLARLDAPVVVLLNNDIRMAPGALDPLVEPLARQLVLALHQRPWFMTAPCCWLEDGVTYEGFRTAVAWRWGLVQATARFPGHASWIDCPGPTASAGAVMAVDRESFVRLGGFDCLYAPGRLEDLDLCYRAFVAGQQCLYVPDSVVWHCGQATFEAVLGREQTLSLALRNTILFQWKHLRHPWHVLRFAAAQPLRLAYDLLSAPMRPSAARFRYARALMQAWQVQRSLAARGSGQSTWTAGRWAAVAREREFFRRFAPRAMKRRWVLARPHSARTNEATMLPEEERLASLSRAHTRGRDCSGACDSRRPQNYPLSRWWLLPLAARLAVRLAPSWVLPWHVSMMGLMMAAAAAAVCLRQPGGSIAAGLLVMAAWFCDRLDGQLARCQQRETRRGAWLDANLDELADVLIHAAAASGLAHATSSAWPWAWLALFLSGKYLLMYGMAEERALVGDSAAVSCKAAPVPACWAQRTFMRLARAAWHLPANADVRAYLTAAAVGSGLISWELAMIGLYYHLRWTVRYALVLHRLGGLGPAEARV